MKKIPTLFERDYSGTRPVTTRTYNRECLWVPYGDGHAHKKLDGTSCMVKDGQLYKRLTLKGSSVRPSDFVPATEFDPVTNRIQGWIPVSSEDPSDQWHREALTRAIAETGPLPNGTYELVGPKINGNNEKLEAHFLVAHSTTTHYPNCPRTYDELKAWLSIHDIEGIVWHHPNGRMAKIKKSDFGLTR